MVNPAGLISKGQSGSIILPAKSIFTRFDAVISSKAKPNALIIDPATAKKHVFNMIRNQSLNCLSGKQIPCEIDSVCIHGDNINSLNTAKSIKDDLLKNGLELKALNKMKKFIR